LRYNARALQPFTWKRYIIPPIPRFFSIPLSCLDYYKSLNSYSIHLQPSVCLDAMTNTVFATIPTSACKLFYFFFVPHFCANYNFFFKSIGANWDGKESCATSASAIQVVFTDPANNRGSATATKAGVVCFAIKILTTAPITSPARTAAPVSTRAKVLTPVPALPNTLEPIANWSKMTAPSFLASTVEPVR